MTRGNSSTAPLEALRLFTLTSTGRRAVSLSGSTRNTHQYWNHAHIGRMKQVHTTKTNFNEACLASVLSSFQNSLKQSKIKKNKKIAGDRKIYNSQLVMSLVYRSTLQATTMVQRDPWSGRHPLCLASSVICCKKKKKDRACLLHYCQDKIQERQSTGGLKDNL